MPQPATLTDVMNWAFWKVQRQPKNPCYWERPIEKLLDLVKTLDPVLKRGNKQQRQRAKRQILSMVNRGLASGYWVEVPSARPRFERRGALLSSESDILIELLTDRNSRNAIIHSRKVLQYMWELSQGMSEVPPPWRA